MKCTLLISYALRDKGDQELGINRVLNSKIGSYLNRFYYFLDSYKTFVGSVLGQRWNVIHNIFCLQPASSDFQVWSKKEGCQ